MRPELGASLAALRERVSLLGGAHVGVRAQRFELSLQSGVFGLDSLHLLGFLRRLRAHGADCLRERLHLRVQALDGGRRCLALLLQRRDLFFERFAGVGSRNHALLLLCEARFRGDQQLRSCLPLLVQFYVALAVSLNRGTQRALALLQWAQLVLELGHLLSGLVFLCPQGCRVSGSLLNVGLELGSALNQRSVLFVHNGQLRLAAVSSFLVDFAGLADVVKFGLRLFELAVEGLSMRLKACNLGDGCCSLLRHLAPLILLLQQGKPHTNAKPRRAGGRVCGRRAPGRRTAGFVRGRSRGCSRVS